MLLLLWGGFGLIFGSFANVLILREATGESIQGRSHCASCRRELQWFELIPLLSWIILRGRCRTCRAPISLQYPIVEALMMGSFLLIGFSPAPLIERILAGAIAFLYIIILVYDLYHMLIPDLWSYAVGVLAALSSLIHGVPPLWLIIGGASVALPLFLLWLVSQGRWMGFGDVLLAVGMGFLLGVMPGLLALGIAFNLGAIVGLCIVLPFSYFRSSPAGISPLGSEEKSFTMKSEVPFGPFLIIGTCIVWFSTLYGVDILGSALRFLSLSYWW